MYKIIFNITLVTNYQILWEAVFSGLSFRSHGYFLNYQPVYSKIVFDQKLCSYITSFSQLSHPQFSFKVVRF